MGLIVRSFYLPRIRTRKSRWIRHDVCFRDQQVGGPWELQGIGEYAHLLDHARSKLDVCVLLEQAGRRCQRWLSSRETVGLHLL
jgi:hypothetical protein